MSFIKFSVFFMAALAQLGCVSWARPNAKAFDGVSPLYPPDVVRQLADDAAQRLASFPASGKFSVNTGTEFGRAIDEALRRQGFPLAAGGPSLQYSVDMLKGASPPACYVSLTLPDGANINQIYELSGSGVSPTGNIVKAGLPDAAGMPPAAGENGLYALEASPDRLVAGQAAEVVFTLKREGRPAGGVKARFESHPNFPNLRDVSRTADKNGTITVRGLKPAQAGAAYLRLVIDRDNYAEAALTVVGKPSFTAADLPVAPVAPPSAPPSAVQSPVPVVSASSAPAMPATVMPAPAMPVASGEWTIAPGLLRGQLEGWAARAGYQLIWKARHDFEMSAKAAFREDFVSAVRRLFGLMHAHGNPLRVVIYQDNQVLEVVEE